MGQVEFSKHTSDHGLNVWVIRWAQRCLRIIRIGLLSIFVADVGLDQLLDIRGDMTLLDHGTANTYRRFFYLSAVLIADFGRIGNGCLNGRSTGLLGTCKVLCADRSRILCRKLGQYQ